VVQTSHPVFTWSVPANEESDYIYVATSPQTTPEGEFYSENVEDSDVFFGNETSWAPTYPLGAGSYWWIIGTHDRETYDSFFTAPRAFSIPAEVAINGVRVKRYTGLRWLDIYVTWRSNTRRSPWPRAFSGKAKWSGASATSATTTASTSQTPRTSTGT
jgi:hypothetical protein